MKMRTIEVVDEITQYLMIFELLLGDINERGFYFYMVNRLSMILILIIYLFKYRFLVFALSDERNKNNMIQISPEKVSFS